MTNISMLISNSKINEPGGLFDFNATLPLVAIQFILLTIILNIILYKPLLTIIQERKKYLLINFNKSLKLLEKTNKLIEQYEEELINVCKEAQIEIQNSQKLHKKILEAELNFSQKSLDNLFDNVTENMLKNKNITINNLDKIVKSLYTDIETKLLI